MSRNLVCTVYDIESRIPELWSRENNRFNEPIGRILDSIEIKSKEIIKTLTQYYASLTISPYLTYPITRPANSHPASLLKKPTLLITDSTLLEADTFILTFTDATSYIISTYYQDWTAAGNTATDMTVPNGLFVVKAADWIGDWTNADTLSFSYQNYENILRQLASYLVASDLLRARYVAEAINAMNGLTFNYSQESKRLLNDIIEGDIKLECFTTADMMCPSSDEAWQGYSVDINGLISGEEDTTNA